MCRRYAGISLAQTLRDLSSMQETLVSKQAASKAQWLDAIQTLKTQQVTLTTELSERTDDMSNIDVLRAEEVKARDAFQADYVQKRLTPKGKPMIWRTRCVRPSRSSIT